MNTLVIVLIAAVCLVAAYALYGRWIARSWGIDPNAKTPAVLKNDGKDYVPTDAGPFSATSSAPLRAQAPSPRHPGRRVRLAARFLWIILGGIFFGAVTDFGRAVRQRQERRQIHGPADRKTRDLVLFCGLVIAAFADMVAGTFNAYDAEGALAAAAKTNGAAGSISLFFIAFAILFGLVQRRFQFKGAAHVAWRWRAPSPRSCSACLCR